MQHFSRSTFLAFVRLPGGRTATLEYFKRLNLFPKPLLIDNKPFGHIVSGNKRTRRRGELFKVNPKLPQIPPGTQTVLVRRMMLVGQSGEPTATRLCESVQLRVYREVPDEMVVRDREHRSRLQDAYEFEMSRPLLFSGRSGGIRPVDVAKPRYFTFASHGESDFQRPPHARGCVTCHHQTGIHSIQSYTKSGFRQGGLKGFSLKNIHPGRTTDVYWALEFKQRRFDWGLLQGLREADSSRR